jgi:hypothetical protein
MFLGLDLKTWLGLTVLGAAVSTIGSLGGIVLKDFFFTRSFERWKQRQSLEQIYEKFRDPLLLAAHELASRTFEIVKLYPTPYLTEDVLASRPLRQIENCFDDPYFKRYKLISTAYRLSAFLGWLELYRQEITFLNSGNNGHAKALELVVDHIRSALADGQLNEAENWREWNDNLVFREELRAIGESMIETRGATRAVIGYGRYSEYLESRAPSAVLRWSPVVMHFFLELQSEQTDFRYVRLKRMVVHLVDLMQLLDGSSIKPYLLDAQRKLFPEISSPMKATSWLTRLLNR